MAAQTFRRSKIEKVIQRFEDMKNGAEKLGVETENDYLITQAKTLEYVIDTLRNEFLRD
jgi:hypothetical protein